jgi:hypothetical protein
MRGIDKLQNPPRPRAPRSPRKTETQGLAEANAGAEVGVVAPAPEVRKENTEPPHAAPPTPTTVSTPEAELPRSDPGATTSEATSSTEAPSTGEPVVGSPSTPSTPAPAAGEPGAKTSEDFPVFEPTEEEIERDFPEWARMRKLERQLARFSGAGNRPGDPASAQPGPSEPSATTSKAIFGRPPPSDPAPPAVGRAPPDGLGPL